MKKIIFILLALVFVYQGTTLATVAAVSAEQNVDNVVALSSGESEGAMQIAGETAVTQNKAIVIVPGVGGSVLRNADGEICWVWLGRVTQLACNTSGLSVNTIVPGTGDYDVGFPTNYYKPLYDVLNAEYGDEYQVLFFPYDWRLNNNAAAQKLAEATDDYDELILVAHSMGGLVASKFCTIAENRNKVDKLITLGTPYTGTPELIYVAETGDFNVWASLAAFGNGTIKDLVKNFHCTYQLAPTTRYQNNYGTYIKRGLLTYAGADARSFYAKRPWATIDGTSTGTTKTMFSSATSFHNNLIASGTHIANSSLVDTYKIVGEGIDTKSLIVYSSDGIYENFEANNSGDGTVPRYSASNTQSITNTNKVYRVTCDHMQLINNAEVNEYIKAIIDGTIATTASVNAISDNPTLNEKGWIMGEDNKRIYITVSALNDVEISDEAGNPVSVSNGYIYNNRGDRIGYVGVVGNNGLKYCLNNGNYTVNILNSQSIPSIKVEYQDNGYYEHIISYDSLNVSEVMLNISKYGDFEVTCVAMPNSTYSAYSADNIIVPSHVMTESELAVRNDY